MRERNVSHEEAFDALNDPDEIQPGDNGGDMAIKRFLYREVRVVFAEIEEDTYFVYTVMKPKIRA